MEKSFFIALLLIGLGLNLTSCTTYQGMNQSTFSSIQEGTTMTVVQDHYGAPYDSKTLPNGLIENRYIERLEISHGVTGQVHYILITTSDGRIIDKRIENVGEGVHFHYH